MTLPNRLTILRIVLIPFFVLFSLTSWAASPYLALLLFVAAALTDKLDGYLARKYQLVTSFGKIMDPLADKLLVGTAYLLFLAQGRMGVVPVLLIIAREYAVSSLRVVAMGEGTLLAAAFSGKVITAVQLTVAILFLLWPSLWMPGGAVLEAVLSWIAAAVTLWSGIDYFWTNRALIHTSVRKK